VAIICQFCQIVAFGGIWQIVGIILPNSVNSVLIVAFGQFPNSGGSVSIVAIICQSCQIVALGARAGEHNRQDSRLTDSADSVGFTNSRGFCRFRLQNSLNFSGIFGRQQEPASSPSTSHSYRQRGHADSADTAANNTHTDSNTLRK
jgi:hypothetical protein